MAIRLQSVGFPTPPLAVLASAWRDNIKALVHWPRIAVFVTRPSAVYAMLLTMGTIRSTGQGKR